MEEKKYTQEQFNIMLVEQLVRMNVQINQLEALVLELRSTAAVTVNHNNPNRVIREDGTILQYYAPKPDDSTCYIRQKTIF